MMLYSSYYTDSLFFRWNHFLHPHDWPEYVISWKHKKDKIRLKKWNIVIETLVCNADLAHFKCNYVHFHQITNNTLFLVLINGVMLVWWNCKRSFCNSFIENITNVSKAKNDTNNFAMIKLKIKIISRVLIYLNYEVIRKFHNLIWIQHYIILLLNCLIYLNMKHVVAHYSIGNKT